MDRTAFRIGEVASGAGVSVDTVRYYERLKLLPRVSRSSGNFRLFAPESIERVRFIKQAQELGLTLEEIRGLLATGGADECRKVRDLLSEKIEEMRAMKEFAFEAKAYAAKARRAYISLQVGRVYCCFFKRFGRLLVNLTSWKGIGVKTLQSGGVGPSGEI